MLNTSGIIALETLLNTSWIVSDGLSVQFPRVKSCLGYTHDFCSNKLKESSGCLDQSQFSWQSNQGYVIKNIRLLWQLEPNQITKSILRQHFFNSKIYPTRIEETRNISIYWVNSILISQQFYKHRKETYVLNICKIYVNIYVLKIWKFSFKEKIHLFRLHSFFLPNKNYTHYKQ